MERRLFYFLPPAASILATLMDTIARNLAQVRTRIADAAQAAGRRPEEIRLIAVSKTLPREYIAAAVQAGQKDFGENTVQDALTKIPHFAEVGLDWHFIGHLQSNKVKSIPGNFTWVHSLHALPLAQRLSRLAQEQRVTVNVLIEVNIARDPAKHGVAPEHLPVFVEHLLQANLPGITLRGLMAMGPYPANEQQLRSAFAAVRNLRDNCAQRYALPSFSELSLGMSGDYVEAIKEGSTMVRIGTAIFGARDHLKQA